MEPDDVRPSAEDAIGVPPDEADAVQLFLALGTQWRTGGMSGARLGLDYQAIEPTARMLEVPMRPQLLADLRVMEAEALQVFAEKEAR